MWQVKENSTQITGKDCLLVRKLQMFFFYFLNVNICFLLFADTYVLAVKPKSIATNKLKISRMAQGLKRNQEPGGIPGQGEDRGGVPRGGGLSWVSNPGHSPRSEGCYPPRTEPVRLKTCLEPVLASFTMVTGIYFC